MATVNVLSTLDVIPKFNCLMTESVAGESIYIRSKETLEAIFKDNSINSADKAQVIANVIGSMATSITSTAMATAIQWASRERELAMEKLKLEKELDVIDQDIELRKSQVEKSRWDSIATQANTIRMYGTPTIVNGIVMALAPEGKVLWDTRLVEQQETNLHKEEDLLVARLKESQANVHRIVADTVVNHGAWTYSVSDAGIATPPMRVGPSAVVPLSDIQRIIAAEQAKGYSYNAWANSVTASAGMLGTAIASDGAIDDVASLVTLFRTSLEKLQSVTAPVIPA